MKTIMAMNLHDSSFSFSRRYFKLGRKSDEEDEDDKSLDSSFDDDDDLMVTMQVKRKSSSKVVLRLRSVFTKQRPPLSSCLGTRVVCTLFGHRNGHVNFAFQEDPKSHTGFFIEIPTKTSSLIREMASGLVRIALECDKVERNNVKLLEEALWRTYCNGKKCGIAIRQEVGPEELKVLKAVGPVSVGAGVLPGIGTKADGELMYMRAKFERVVGSKHSEAFYMMNPDGSVGAELSIYLLRV